MSKSPRIRHSRDTAKPVTIDLEAAAVEGSTATPVEPAAAEPEDATATAAETTEAEPVPAAASPIDSGPAEPDPPPASGDAPPPAKAAPRRGFASLLAAGLVGGVAATGGNWAYDRFFAPPAPPTAPAFDIAAELKARDGRIDAVAAALDAVRADVDGVKGALAAIEPPGKPDLSAVENRLAELEKKFANLAIAGGDPVAAEKLASFDAKLAELAAVAAAASDAAKAASETAAAQAARIDAIAAAARAAEEKAAAAAGNPKIALAIAAAALKSAVDRGLPFMTELETYAAVAPGAPEIASLRGFAAAGVPTRADLATAAGEAAVAMIAAMSAGDPQAGFFQRLLDSAKALVTVRPIGMVEGDSIEAIAARVEARTKAGDLRGALDEFGKAPEAAKAAAAGFAAKVEGRLTVENLIDAALAAALKSGG